MIERYFSQTKVLIRLQSGPVGPYLPGFVSALEESRFSRDSIRRLIRGADRLCRWLDGQGVELVESKSKPYQAIRASACTIARHSLYAGAFA